MRIIIIAARELAGGIFNIQIIMRRISMIYYHENHGNEIATLQCLSDRKLQLSLTVIGMAINTGTMYSEAEACSDHLAVQPDRADCNH